MSDLLERALALITVTPSIEILGFSRVSSWRISPLEGRRARVEYDAAAGWVDIENYCARREEALQAVRDRFPASVGRHSFSCVSADMSLRLTKLFPGRHTSSYVLTVSLELEYVP